MITWQTFTDKFKLQQTGNEFFTKFFTEAKEKCTMLPLVNFAKSFWKNCKNSECFNQIYFAKY